MERGWGALSESPQRTQWDSLTGQWSPAETIPKGTEIKRLCVLARDSGLIFSCKRASMTDHLSKIAFTHSTKTNYVVMEHNTNTPKTHSQTQKNWKKRKLSFVRFSYNDNKNECCGTSLGGS